MRRLFAAVCLLALASPALATAPAPDPATDSSADWQLWLDGGPRGDRVMPAPLGPFNYLREFDQIVGFLADWQVSDPDSSDYGGEIEAEAGYLGDVIQTDNTLESIWCWSRYKQLTGSTAYDDNIAAAWVYSTNYPAWLEEGAAGDDYYRVHNCAWGLTAVLMYAEATGDHSYDAYAETCAQYIVDHPLVIDGTVWNQRLDAFCKGWAAGNLYIFSEATGNLTYRDSALIQGDDVLAWIDAAPAANLATEYWAMSSGTALWGVCNSVFAYDPAYGQNWLATNAQYVDTWQDWYSVPGYDWDVAWNVAYGNAHFAIYDLTGDPAHLGYAKTIMDALLSYDTDDDGGIVSQSTDPVTEDMTWVTNYLCKFGVDRLMGEVFGNDTGVLRFGGLVDGQQFGPGETIPIVIQATNFGLAGQTGVTVELEGDYGTGSWTRNLPFVAVDTLVVNPAWTPPTPGSYTLSAIVTKATGQTVLDYLKPRLFEPLGIDNPKWESSAEGYNFGGYGLFLRTEDIAKFGQLYLQKGQWKGKQLLPAPWIEAATAKQVDNDKAPSGRTPDWQQGYGFQFWRCQHRAYRGDGRDGQLCLVMPEQDAVIAITALTGQMQTELDLVWEKLLPAFGENPLPVNAAALAELRQAASHLTAHPLVKGR